MYIYIKYKICRYYLHIGRKNIYTKEENNKETIELVLQVLYLRLAISTEINY